MFTGRFIALKGIFAYQRNIKAWLPSSASKSLLLFVIGFLQRVLMGLLLHGFFQFSFQFA